MWQIDFNINNQGDPPRGKNNLNSSYIALCDELLPLGKQSLGSLETILYKHPDLEDYPVLVPTPPKGKRRTKDAEKDKG